MTATVAFALDKSASKDKLRVWIRLLRTTRRIEAGVREKLRLEFGTTLPRFDVMAALARSPEGLTMSALSRHLLVSNGNVTGIVDRLVADGLVARNAVAGDKRTIVVTLTPRGAHDFAAMADFHERWMAKVLSALSPDDAAALMTLLGKFKAPRINPQDVP